MFEKLENRQLFAVTATLDNGTLTLTGDSANDTILFDKSGNSDDPNVRAQINGVYQEWDVDDVQKMVINLGAGDDKVVVGNLLIHCQIDGGAGNDTLSGGDGDDTITGGAGNDYVFGRAGDDVLDGGAGSDTVMGQLGDDTLQISGKPGKNDFYSGGGDGHDVLDGRTSQVPLFLQVGRTKPRGLATAVVGDDFETIQGSKYGDVLRDFGTHPIEMYGNGGADILIGGSGHADTLDGGTGIDTIVSNNVRSWIFSSDKVKDLISGQVLSSHIKGDKIDLLSLDASVKV